MLFTSMYIHMYIHIHTYRPYMYVVHLLIMRYVDLTWFSGTGSIFISYFIQPLLMLNFFIWQKKFFFLCIELKLNKNERYVKISIGNEMFFRHKFLALKSWIGIKCEALIKWILMSTLRWNIRMNMYQVFRLQNFPLCN